MSVFAEDQSGFFRTISVMVNAMCDLGCPHCDLPSRYRQYDGALSATQWAELLDRIIPDVAPEVIAVAAREPLLPEVGMPQTTAILETAQKHGIDAGFVSSGLHAGEFFAGIPKDLRFSFMDLSVEGPPDVDAAARGPEHFGIVDAFLQTRAYKPFVERVYISCVLSKANARVPVFSRFLDWIESRLESPRLALLLLYPNQNVAPGMALDDEDLLRVLDLLVERSSRFADLFLEAFPSSLPGLAQLVETGVLPGEGEVRRDAGGMLWGHVAEDLFIRYNNCSDLLRYHLRISPEGFALPPEKPGSRRLSG